MGKSDGVLEVIVGSKMRTPKPKYGLRWWRDTSDDDSRHTYILFCLTRSVQVVTCISLRKDFRDAVPIKNFLKSTSHSSH